MSEMVERVARAICGACGQDPDARTGYSTGTAETRHHQTFAEAAEVEARAAIAAMRSPTEAMLKAGAPEDDFEIGEGDALMMWRAMVDAALK